MSANPWPIDDARHNVWLLACELALLEGHLAEGRRCPKCVTKHLATVEALAREGRTLDHVAGELALFERVLATLPRLGWARDVNPAEARELLRGLRRAACARQLELGGAPALLRG